MHESLVLDLTAGICKDCHADMLSVIKAILVFTQELRIVSAVDNASISAWKIEVVLDKDTDCSWSEFKIAWSSIAGSTNAPAPTTSSLAEPSA